MLYLIKGKICETNKILADEKGRPEKTLRKKNKAPAGLGELGRVGRLKKQGNMPSGDALEKSSLGSILPMVKLKVIKCLRASC